MLMVFACSSGNNEITLLRELNSEEAKNRMLLITFGVIVFVFEIVWVIVLVLLKSSDLD